MKYRQAALIADQVVRALEICFDPKATALGDTIIQETETYSVTLASVSFDWPRLIQSRSFAICLPDIPLQLRLMI